jgi:trehalose-6-phosphate synthase
LKTPAHNHQTNGRISLGGRARHSVYAAIGINPNRLSHAAASQTLAERLTRKARKKPRNNTFILLSF